MPGKSEVMQPVHITEHGYNLEVIIYDNDGTVKDVSSYTAFRFIVWDITDNTTAVVDETMTKVNTGSDGKVSFVVGDTDFDALTTDGTVTYHYTVEYTKSGVKERTMQAEIVFRRGGPT